MQGAGHEADGVLGEVELGVEGDAARALEEGERDEHQRAGDGAQGPAAGTGGAAAAVFAGANFFSLVAAVIGGTSAAGS
nr:hypothetical protein GCM10020092_015100 [Actinoplanes digitatis]